MSICYMQVVIEVSSVEETQCGTAMENLEDLLIWNPRASTTCELQPGQPALTAVPCGYQTPSARCPADAPFARLQQAHTCLPNPPVFRGCI
jgi:hypothetical protein